MNLIDDRSCVELRTARVTAPVELDRWSLGELDAATTAVIVLDHGGLIVATSPTAARWLGVSAWQVRGRALLGELRWALGDVASQRVAEFLRADRGTVPATTTRASGRRGPPVDLELVRGRDRIYLTLTPPQLATWTGAGATLPRFDRG